MTEPKTFNETSYKAFFEIGVAYQRMANAMGKTTLAFWQGAHSVCKFRDKITRRQQLAIWILDTAERFAGWVTGGEND